ncbi:MAG TPA: hypothetical protein VGX48_25320, partial [Pyrinomonadaceae bacterium]|nr:hypothetical protein [Pyrinomonadaceae bacterium]
MSNRVVIEVAVDEDGKASAALHSLEGDVLRFTAGVNKAGGEGVRLRDVFAGNLLSDYFQRGVSAALEFSASTIQAAAAASDANRQLEFSATQAGLSYTRAAELAEDFGKRVGASNAEAARTFADIVRLAERAGRLDGVENLSRGFADLAAARGIKGAELQNLIGTILSGQDEGLNRLGADDPSKLNAAYAASIGKTADALNQQEKAAAAVVAVEGLMAQAQGESGKRLQSTAGRLDTAAAAYQNLTTQIGESFANSVEFNGLLALTSKALGTLVTSHEEARRELAKGLTPEQVAGRERQGAGRQVLNFLKGESLVLPTLATAALGGALGSEELIRRARGLSSLTFNPGQSQYDARVAQLRELQEEMKRQEAEALANQQSSAAKAAAAAQRSALASQFGDNLEAASKEQDLNARLGKLKDLKEELRRLPDVLDATEFEKRSKKIDEAIRETAKQVAAAVRTARDAARDLLGDAIIRADDNPFT